MSFTVQGIDLPKEGEEHRIIIHHNGQAIIDKRTYYEEAQAVQLPKKHGRLIDADASLEELRAMKVEGETFMTAVEFAKITIKDAPTILEAEE